jgi:hypothetical protein
MMALALKADEAEEKWNLSLEDFKDINFNL